MRCESCELEHDGSYGSGRFCNAKCARAFSTKSKRKEISEKVATKLKGRPSKFKGVVGKKHTKESKSRITQGLKKFYREHPEILLSDEEKRVKNVSTVMAYRARKRKAILETTDLELIKKIYGHCPQGYHVDHIHALAKGGAHHQDNLQYLPGAENCRKCADRDYDKSLAIDWRTIVFSLIE